MIRWLFIFIIFVLLILIYFYNLINQNESKVLYFPSKRQIWKPKIPYKNVYINVDDPKDVCYSSKDKKKDKDYISGWHFNNFKYAKTIMFCHGNSGNITHRKYIVDICHKFKLNLFIFDYRGFGKSDSFPHKLFLREDGDLVYDYLNETCKIQSSKLIIWGESLGGITAVWTSSRHDCSALILLSCFSSLDDAITYRYKGKTKIAADFLTGLLSYKMDMIPLKEYIKKVKCRTVIMHSKGDDIIPYTCSLINYDSIKHTNKMHIKIKGKHSSPDIKSNQLRSLFRFCNLSLNNISSDVNISDILENLKNVAAKYHNFID